jgi:hypothetical protein
MSLMVPTHKSYSTTGWQAVGTTKVDGEVNGEGPSGAMEWGGLRSSLLSDVIGGLAALDLVSSLAQSVGDAGVSVSSSTSSSDDDDDNYDDDD